MGSMGEGWLIDRDRMWVCRFHRDEKAWLQDPMVFVDLSRGMPGGEQRWLDGWADTGRAQTASAPEESSAI